MQSKFHKLFCLFLTKSKKVLTVSLHKHLRVYRHIGSRWWKVSSKNTLSSFFCCTRKVVLVFQCSECREYFMGTPTNNHQCYRQMTVDKEYCFDPETQNNCNREPMALRQGRTVFFAVQPKYLNVNIRITIDVTMGGKI